MSLDRQRLQAYRYVTGEEAASYLAVMRVFTGSTSGLLSDLSASEVAAALEEAGAPLDVDSVEARLGYLVDHGNLVRSPREAEARSIREYLTTRARYQLTPLGEQAHRHVEELLGSAGRVREVSTEVLPVLLRGLEVLAADPRAGAGEVTALFAVFERLVTSTRDFYARLGEVLARAEVDREALAAYREVLLDYLQRFVDEVRRYEPLVVEALARVDVDAVLAAAAADGPHLVDEAGQAALRATGLQRGDWSSLAAWFRGSSGRRSDAAEVRALATRAMGTLLGGLRRAVASTGAEASRRGDLLRLARLFDAADDDTAHRVWGAAFGLYPSRHLSALPEVDDVPATTSWWDAPPAQVPLSLREHGDRTIRGRGGRREDFGAQREELLRRRQQEEDARAEALGELRGQRGRAELHLSDAGRSLLLDLYARALAAADGPRDVAAGGATTRSGTLTLTAHHAPGLTTSVRSPAGVLQLVDVRLELRDEADEADEAAEATA
jgi:uncharacterized protein (TIGR02677 family)